MLLLLHGTGAATHSWRTLLPLLAEHFRVIAPDLPGHAFSTVGDPADLSLPGMARTLAAMLVALDESPALVVGHSAGAAIAVRMCLDQSIHPRGVVSLNGALLQFGGIAGRLFSPAARLLASSPVVPKMFSHFAANPAVVARLLDSTGSSIDATGAAFYRRIVESPAHAAAALGMMARWDLHALERDLPKLAIPLLLVVGSIDRTVPPGQGADVRRRVREARVVELPGLGHLAHEERPQLVFDILLRFAREVGVLPG